ncbi:MAG: HlyD family efflux transporter periplasmic adaptor subunit [Cyanobacteria bacterium J06641_5]
MKGRATTLAVLGLALVSAIASGVVYRQHAGTGDFAVASEGGEPDAVGLPAIRKVTALGRLEPQGEVMQVSSSQAGAVVARLLVEEGDRVTAGEAVAVLDDYAHRQAAVMTAKGDVRVAAANLAVVEAGAKAGEIVAQEATIARLKAERSGEDLTQSATIERLRAELRNAEAEFERHAFLTREGAISASEGDRYELDLDTARERLTEAETAKAKTLGSFEQQILEARATLERIAEVRPVEIRQAEAELERARAAQAQAEANLDLAMVKAPMAGQVLDVHTRPGELVSAEDGIVELGQTDRMIVVAEVHESDIPRVRLGQPATFTSENSSFTGEIAGRVGKIGLQIGKKDVLDTDPAAAVDARVVEVEIYLDEAASDRVAGLTNSKAIVTIALER